MTSTFQTKPERISHYMTYRNLTVAKLAQLTGLSRPTVNKYRKQQTGVRAENARRLAEALHTEVAEICDP